jgi:RimJ/RimL family protein N-acetyltransferase
LGKDARVSTFPDLVLSTDRLTLRAFTAEDLAALHEAGRDPVIQRWLPLPSPYLEEHARAWALEVAPQTRTAGRGLVLAVAEGHQLVAGLDLKRTDWAARTTEIGYWTHPEHRGRGFMPEATRALAEWVITDQGFERVELRIAAGNEPSLAVAEKAGFTREGIARNAGYVHGGRVDLVVFSLVPDDLRG